MKRVELDNGLSHALVPESYDPTINITTYVCSMPLKGYTLQLFRDVDGLWMSCTTLHKKKTRQDGTVTPEEVWGVANEHQTALGERLEQQLLHHIAVTE